MITVREIVDDENPLSPLAALGFIGAIQCVVVDHRQVPIAINLLTEPGRIVAILGQNQYVALLIERRYGLGCFHGDRESRLPTLVC